MALMRITYFSKVLFRTNEFLVSLPEPSIFEPGNKLVRGMKYQTLLLLHGGSDNHTDWQRKSNVERYAYDHKLAVIYPNAALSFYTDMAYGEAYWTAITEEIPRVARMYFPLSDKREDNFVAGLSMGGYGTMKMAFRLHDKFAAAASLSGAVDIASVASQAIPDVMQGILSNMMDLVFKDRHHLHGTDDDLYALAENAAAASIPLPQIRLYCGIDDFLCEDNQKFSAKCQQLGIDAPLNISAGNHEWDYWNRTIKTALREMPLRNEPIYP